MTIVTPAFLFHILSRAWFVWRYLNNGVYDIDLYALHNLKRHPFGGDILLNVGIAFQLPDIS